MNASSNEKKKMTPVGISSVSLRDNVHVATESTKEIRAREKSGLEAKTLLSPSVSNRTRDIRKFFYSEDGESEKTGLKAKTPCLT